MNNFTFTGKLKTSLITFMVIGLVSMGLTYAMFDDQLHTRFWTNFLHNSVFFTGVSFIALFVMSAFIIMWAGWYTVMKRILEAFSQFLIVGLVLMLVIALGAYFDLHHLYHWADAESVAGDKILTGKSPFLNKNWMLFSTIIVVSVWYFFARKMRALSIAEENAEEGDYAYHNKMRFFSAIFMLFGGFSSVLVIWQWLMSLDGHWYSTMYAWYTTASWFVTMIAMVILMVLYLKTKGYYKSFTNEHLHDFGKLLFAFSIFWTYLWFSQYMLIWYSNNGEETVYFWERTHNYSLVFWGTLVINFAIPLLVLLPNSMKRFRGVMIFMAVVLIFGHWLDFFQMVKPGALHTAHELMDAGVGHAVDTAHEVARAVADSHGAESHGDHGHSSTPGFTIPGLLEIGTFLGFLGLFLFVSFTSLAKASLESKNDPYYDESLHHHVV